MKKNILFIFFLLAPLAIFSQIITSVSPDTVTAGQTLNITITGTQTHFQSGSGTSVNFNFQQVSGTSASTLNSINILSETSLIANITISSGAYTGDYRIGVYNSIDGYLTPSNPNLHIEGVRPAITSTSPSSANAGETLDVTITGVSSRFQSGSGTTISFGFGQGSSTINSMSVLSETSIIANITVPSNLNTGFYDVNVNNSIDGFLSLHNYFYVNGYNPPSISINPPAGAPGQTLNVTVSGRNTHFSSVSGTNVYFNFNQVSGTTVINSQQIINDTIIQVNITVPSNVDFGYYKVAINNSIDGYVASNYDFQVINPNPPKIVAIQPGGAKAGQTLKVTITGNNTHFDRASTTVNFDFNQVSGTAVKSFNVINNTSIVATITVPPTASLGKYSVYINNVVDGYMKSDFYIYENCFAHYATSYNQVANQFKLTLDSVTSAVGKSFYWSFGDGATSIDETPTHLFAADQLYTVYLKVTTANGDTCSYLHEIGKDRNGNIVRGAGFSMGVVRYDESVGVAQISDNKIKTSIYPNPFYAQTTITLSEDVKNAILKIMDVTGREVKSINFSGTTVQIEKGGLNTGLYFLQVTENNKIIATNKVVIQ